MSTPSTLREFLISRRAQIDPSSVGLPPSPVARRGKGLRREEVAALAGVSVDYYARLEQGRTGNISDQVLTAIEDALRSTRWSASICGRWSARRNRDGSGVGPRQSPTSGPVCAR